MKKIFSLLLLLLSFGSTSLQAQDVDKQTFDEAIDYLNCRIAELSMADQRGRPHYVAFRNQMVQCDLSEIKGSFHTTLQAFLSRRRLVKSMQLATFIDALKIRYKSDYSRENMYKLVVDTLMNSQTLLDFKQKHQLTISAVETQVQQQIYELFRVADRDADIDNVRVNEGEVSTFTDSSEIDDNYQNLDGGKRSNNELVTDSEEKDKEPEGDRTVSLTEPTFFDNYRWHILGILMIAGLGYYWFTRSSSPFTSIKNPLATDNRGKGNPRISNDEVQNLRNQLEEMKQSEIDLQEQITQLQFKVEKFAELLNDKGVDTTTIIEEEELIEDVAFDDIEEDVIDNNLIDDDDLEKSLIGTVDMAKGANFFLPIPNAEGIFDGNQATDEFKRPHSVYIFTVISDDGKQAEFKIHEDIATMIRALDNFDDYLRPACRSGSILHKNATKIITSENGLAIQEDGKWKVVTKAVIHYT